jgi:uroporphyrinogen decarboxylase
VTADPDPARPDLPSDSDLVRAARGLAVSRTPVWFMRQAGRSLPEYRALREGTAMLEACQDPDLVTEITLQPVRRCVRWPTSTPCRCSTRPTSIS